MAIDSAADARIAAINEQRDRAQGIPSIPYDAKFAKEMAETNAFIRKFDQDLLNSTRAWTSKCHREIDEKLRQMGAQ